jgi:regulator of replication initiation timing
VKIRNPKYPFKQCVPWENCPTCFEDFSLTPCTNCGNGFEDEYIEVPSELEQLTTRIVELEAEVERLSAAHVKARQANADLQVELTKAEQRVAEACALQVATEIKFHWLDAARVAKEIRSGEWRKFVKEV